MFGLKSHVGKARLARSIGKIGIRTPVLIFARVALTTYGRPYCYFFALRSAHMLSGHSCLPAEERGLLAFLALRNSGSVVFSPDRDLQSVLSDHVAALSLNVKRGNCLLFWRV